MELDQTLEYERKQYFLSIDTNINTNMPSLATFRRPDISSKSDKLGTF